MSGNRILLVEGSGRGFLSHYAHALALGLHEQGNTVRLVTGRRDELAHWAAPFEKSACLPDGARSWACLAGEVKRFQPRTVHFQWVGQPLWASAFVAAMARRGIGTAYTPHNILPHKRRWLSTPGYRLLYSMLDRVVARDPNIAWGLEEVMDVAARAVTHLPGSPNLMAHPALPRSRPRELARIPSDAPLILHFGHGSPRKGLDLLAEALGGPMAGSHARVVVAGEGVLSALPSAARHTLLNDRRVTVIDRYLAADEVGWLFSRAHALLLPYTKLCESPLLDLAAQFALPVVRSGRVSGPRFVEGTHGLTMTSTTAGALADAVAASLVPATRSRMKAALYREESVQAAIRRLAEGHVRLYAEMAGSTAPRGVRLIDPASVEVTNA